MNNLELSRLDTQGLIRVALTTMRICVMYKAIMVIIYSRNVITAIDKILLSYYVSTDKSRATINTIAVA